MVFIIAQCCGHHIHILKAFNIEHNGKPFKLVSYIRDKWIPFAEIQTKSGIQKRELESGGAIPLMEEKPPAPVIEHFEEKENLEASSTFFGLQRPVLGVNRVPLTRSIEPGLNTNIQGSLPPVDIFNPAQIPPNSESQGMGEIFEGLPPRPVGPIPAEPVPETMVVSPPNNPVIPPPVQKPVIEEAPPALFDRTRVRQYAVYAGDVILKYLSQFFNRARLTFNRFTSPPPPTPVFEN